MTRGNASSGGGVPSVPGRHRVALLLAAAVVVAADQLSKQWALGALSDGPIAVMGSLRLRLTFNDSAAFSLGGGRTTLIALLALAVAGIILRIGLQAEQRVAAVGLGVILGGALGNLADRLLRSGHGLLGGRVVDFIDLQWWPVFNVADTSLWVGLGLLGIGTWQQRDRRP